MAKKPEIRVRCEYTEMADPNKLNPHPQNAHKHPKAQIRMLEAAIRSVGWTHPIIVSKRTGLILAGHARRTVAISIGCDAPVDIQEYETDAEEMQVLMGDNILPELAEIDTNQLEINKEILLAANIELETIGIPEIETGNTEIDDLDLEDIEYSSVTKKYIVKVDQEDASRLEAQLSEIKKSIGSLFFREA